MTVYGGQQQHGVKYTETYTHVASWYTIQTLIMLSLLKKWHTRKIYFVLSFPQELISYDIFMKLLTVLIINEVNQKTRCLQLLNIIYGRRQAGRVWNQYLVQELLNIFLSNQILINLYFTEVKSFYFSMMTKDAP